MASPSLPHALKHRAGKIAGSRLTTEGEIVITASNHRTQALNRDEAIKRLIDILNRAASPPKRRIATKPTYASKKRRLEAKTKRSTVKRMRQNPIDPD